MNDLSNVIQELRKFRDERDWKQFHNSKNLALALSIEASELNELFLWKDNEEAEKALDKDKFREELADVFSFALLLADKHDLDVEGIIKEKLKKNREKYPVNKAKGNAKKYYNLD